MKLILPGSRELHFYLGLFFSPLLVLFAVSTLMLNHRGSAAIRPTSISQTATEAIPVDPTGTPGSLAQARDLLRQLGIRGEIDYLSHDPRNGTLMIPVTTPGEIVRVDVDLKSRSARVSRREQGLAGALVYLHKMPGPHNAALRGNWAGTVWWAALADGVVYGLLLITMTGLWLWWRSRPGRVPGVLAIGAGVVSLLTLLVGLWCG